MDLNRNDSRMLAMVILYQIDLFSRKEVEFDVEKLIEGNLVDVLEGREFTRSLIDGVLEHEKEIIGIANSYLNNWSIYRLGVADAAILKIAIYELLYTDTPDKVCIDEAIELAKDFSDEKVVGMINGVLDKVYHKKCNKEG